MPNRITGAGYSDVSVEALALVMILAPWNQKGTHHGSLGMRSRSQSAANAGQTAIHRGGCSLLCQKLHYYASTTYEGSQVVAKQLN